MDVIAHDSKREQIDSKHGREELQAFLNPLAAIVKTLASNLIGATKISPTDDALADMKHTDLIFINNHSPSQPSPHWASITPAELEHKCPSALSDLKIS